jgi:hypothetical protein
VENENKENENVAKTIEKISTENEAKKIENSTGILIKPNESKNEKHVEKRIHESWIQSYIDFTQYQESPTLFHLWVAISTIAAALNRNTYIQRGYSRLFPNLYTVLVSPTGKSKKSSAADIGIDSFSSKIDGVRLLRDESTPKGLVQFLSLSPVITEGTKIYQNCTAYLYATELADLLGDQSYNAGLTKKLTSLWDCKSIYEDTTKELLVKNKKPVRLTNICINLLGCSNPEWLAHGMKEDAFGGGFMGRILFIFSNKTRKTDASAWMDIPKDIKITELTLLRDLQKISQLRGAFTIEKEAHTYFVKLYREYNGDFTGRMAGYLERKLVYVLKLAMIISVNYSDEMIITKSHIDEALGYLEEIEESMPSAFVYINATNEARISQHIIESIKENKGALYRDIMFAKFRHLVRSIREFDDILQMLIESNTIRLLRREDKIIYVLSDIYEQEIKTKEKELFTLKEKLEREANVQIEKDHLSIDVVNDDVDVDNDSNINITVQ